MSLFIQGVCVGKKSETIQYKDKDGKDKEFSQISASFASSNGFGKPIDVDMEDYQLPEFKPFAEQYCFPVDVRAITTKRGTFCRISILEGAEIKRQPFGIPGSTGSQANAGTPANPNGK